MKTFDNKKSAFTMLEMVFGIVVISIIATLAIPRMDRDLKSEAKAHIISALRYTQHLALVDDRRDPFDATWQSKLWHISFATDGSNYTISSGSNFAVDATDGKLLDSTATGSKSNLIGKKYGIDGVTASGGCSSPLVAYDNLGRVYDSITSTTPDYAHYVTTDCILTISFASSSISDLVINISTETGNISGN